MTAIAKTLVGVDGRTDRVWPLLLERNALFELFRELFDEPLNKLTWGPLIPGAAYQLTGNALDGRDRRGKGYRKIAG